MKGMCRGRRGDHHCHRHRHKPRFYFFEVKAIRQEYRPSDHLRKDPLRESSSTLIERIQEGEEDFSEHPGTGTRVLSYSAEEVTRVTANRRSMFEFR